MTPLPLFPDLEEPQEPGETVAESPQMAGRPSTSWKTRLRGREFRILSLNDASPTTEGMHEPERIAEYLQTATAASPLFRHDVENLLVVHLTARRHIIGWEVICQGTLDTLLTHARETFRGAIIANAHAIVIAHNHPSGDPTPSDADIKVTKDLVRAGQLLKIEVLDHIILGRPGFSCIPGRSYTSLRELGYFTC